MIQGLLSNARYAERAFTVQQALEAEDGLETACDALEAAIRR
jgi:UDP:flavonoid glycosyltransferase YjiC (YdhE family)